MSALESRLRQLAASLGPEALEALASKGLLRRAQKDLDRGIHAAITQEEGTNLRLRVGDYDVVLPESGPVNAKCSCPAAGVCQHILVAVLFLQKPTLATAGEKEPDQQNLAEPTEASGSDVMAFTPDQLERWAGKAAFKTAMRLASQCTPEIIRERALRIRFPSLNCEVHVVPGGGLDGMIVSGGKGDGRQFVVAAVIGYQRAQGIAWTFPAGSGALEAAEGAPRSRAEVLGSCQRLLDETLTNGLSRLSAAHEQRWATLAVSALGVNLPRLALLLRGLGDETALVLARDARSDLARLLARMSQTHALCSALQAGGESPRTDLVGLHRTRYDEVGNLDLVGAAAWPWRTASGYEGLTVLFWDPSAKNWNSWTESRPRHQLANFKPVARFTQPGPWEGAQSPRQLAESVFRLTNARRNPSRRLSGSSKSRVLVTGGVKAREYGFGTVEDWAELSRKLEAQTAFGLKETNPLDWVVAVKPKAWGDRGFDPVTQVFAWALEDLQQRQLKLEIGFDELTEPSIKFLETVTPATLEGALVIGRMERTPRGLSLHPYSIHRQDGEIIHLAFENVTSAITPTATAQNVESEVFSEEEEIESTVHLNSSISLLLDEVDDGLLTLAEGGFAALNPLRIERLRQTTNQAARSGLEGLATALSNVAAQPRDFTILRCSYLSQLHRRALQVST